MSLEQIIGLSLLAGVALLYWREHPRQQTPAAPSPEPRGMEAIMARLDAPKSRAATLARGREVLDQFAADDEVGLVVIAIEPDAVTSHGALSDFDKLQAIAHLLNSLASDTTASSGDRERAQNAMSALGLRSTAR
jgi:hypothetical protein